LSFSILRRRTLSMRVNVNFRLFQTVRQTKPEVRSSSAAVRLFSQ
jgi:hypothetical protein